MSGLAAFGVMAAAGAASAMIYGVLTDVYRAAGRVFRPRRGCAWPKLLRGVQDVLSVLAGAVLFLLCAYACASGAVRGYVLGGFLCGALLYGGVVTHFTDSLLYFLFCLVLRPLRILFVTLPEQFRKRKIEKNSKNV